MTPQASHILSGNEDAHAWEGDVIHTSPTGVGFHPGCDISHVRGVTNPICTQPHKMVPHTKVGGGKVAFKDSNVSVKGKKNTAVRQSKTCKTWKTSILWAYGNLFNRTNCFLQCKLQRDGCELAYNFTSSVNKAVLKMTFLYCVCNAGIQTFSQPLGWASVVV